MNIWQKITENAETILSKEPLLKPLLQKFILNSDSLEKSLATILASKFADEIYSQEDYFDIFIKILEKFPKIIEASESDLVATKQRDPACQCYTRPLLFYKGFQAIQVARIANKIWHNNQQCFALYLQSKSCLIFSVDIHPNVQIGHGILLDHATSFVAGETSVIGNNVSILHEVTLGGSGKEIGNRHPRVGDGVLIGAGAKLIGNILINEGSKIGAGSVVLDDVAAHVTVVGVPATIVGKPLHSNPAHFMDQRFL